MTDTKINTANEKVGTNADLAHVEDSQIDQSSLPGIVSTTDGWSFMGMFKRVDNTNFFHEALDKYGFEGGITEEQEKKLVRKIDWHILPILGICYVFYYVDKTTLSYAAIFGIKKPDTGLNLHGTEYSWASSAFYFGWLAWAIPANLILQRSPPATYLAVNIFMWGVLLMAQAASGTFTHLVVLRVLSGAFEAVADPTFMLVTSMWYTRAEQPSRISAWYAFNGIGVAIGGLLGYAIGSIHGALASWRYEFIVIGCICSAWGLAIFAVLPNSQASTWWLNREERLMSVARLRGNQTGIENKHFKWDQAKEAFTDVKSLLFFLLGVTGNIPNGGISNFSTLIIAGLGFDTLHTALLGIPQGVIVVLWIAAGAVLNGRLPANSRTWVCALFMLPTICGALGFLLAPTNANVGRLICFYLTGSYQTTFVLSLSLITSNTGGQTKKMIVSALIWFGACVGNIAGPFFYKSEQAPTYRLGIASMLVCNCLELLVILCLRWAFIHGNRKKEAAAARLKEDQQQAVEDDDVKAQASGVLPDQNATAFADLTDKQNINFRYVY